MNTEHENYELLRPFDLEAAKAGEEICWSTLPLSVKFIGVTSDGKIAYESVNEAGFTYAKQFCMKPLAWIEGKPVYKEDVLYWKNTSANGSKFIAKGMLDEETIKGFSYCADGSVYESKYDNIPIGKLTWNKPKQKHKVWINVYKNNDYRTWESKAQADSMAKSGRITCVETEIEY